MCQKQRLKAATRWLGEGAQCEVVWTGVVVVVMSIRLQAEEGWQASQRAWQVQILE